MHYMQRGIWIFKHKRRKWIESDALKLGERYRHQEEGIIFNPFLFLQKIL